jgi:prepilin-type N-terminal cleavage/methylation domain-containing protein
MPSPRFSLRERGAFTLLEVMVTVVIIAIMSALLTPAVRGLMGISGPRGGTNALAAVLEQARLTAMESGQTTFVGFPFGSSNEDAAFSSVIVFRQGRDDENTDYVPVSRWVRMPQGVYLESSSLGDSESVAGFLPKLANEDVQSVNVLRFDRFGKLQGEASPVVIKVGSKSEARGDFSRDGKDYFEVTIQPLTGRAFVVDKARGEGT